MSPLGMTGRPEDRPLRWFGLPVLARHADCATGDMMLAIWTVAMSMAVSVQPEDSEGRAGRCCRVVNVWPCAARAV